MCGVTLGCYTSVDALTRFIVYKLQLEFNPVTNQVAVDALTYALCVLLYVNYRISCTQPTHNILEFESSKDCVFAQLALADDSRYTIKRL